MPSRLGEVPRAPITRVHPSSFWGGRPEPRSRGRRCTFGVVYLPSMGPWQASGREHHLGRPARERAGYDLMYVPLRCAQGYGTDSWLPGTIRCLGTHCLPISRLSTGAAWLGRRRRLARSRGDASQSTRDGMGCQCQVPGTEAIPPMLMSHMGSYPRHPTYPIP